MIIGVDIGGTFTDLVLSDGQSLKIHKLLSTPGNPAEAMLAGLRHMSGGDLTVFQRIAHGSTVATNAILERKGARCALITTEGFRDLLLIGRQNRPGLYELHPQIAPSLIEHNYEVPERLDHTGKILTPLDRDALERVLDAIAALDVEAVAVSLLYSYMNPVHERQIRDRIIARGQMTDEQIALSSDVLPEFREYERTSTAALEAYVRPVMSKYLGELERALPPNTLSVMKSDGGVIGARTASKQAILTALSGPAAGVIGAFHLASLAGYTDIITLDMGGTSTDVALCPGIPIRRADSEIDGLPLRTRVIDIETVGAGGGSIARLDSGGVLHVGPESAGADPGPIVYGRGGQQVTVSDANAVLGRLVSRYFLGGTMQLDLDGAQRALTQLAQTMHLSVNDAAAGIIRLANTNIDRAIRRVSIARGYDPRRFSLFAFGGAGGLHACKVAEGLDIPRVIIPRHPGVLCALGLLVADVTVDYSKSVLGSTPMSMMVVFDQLLRQAHHDLEAEGFTPDKMVFSPQIDVRYVGQAYELTVPYHINYVNLFHEAHAERYGYALRDREVEAVTARVQAIGMVEKPTFPNEASTDVTVQTVGGNKEMTFYDRAQLYPGARFVGAAVVVQPDSTTYIPVGWAAEVDTYFNLILEKIY